MALKPFRINVRVKNNFILSRIEERGHKTVSDFCRQTGVAYVTLIAFVNLRRRPIDSQTGRWVPFATDLAAVLDCLPEELWSEEQRLLAAKTNTVSLVMSYGELSGQRYLPTPEEAAIRAELPDIVSRALDTLRPREALVIRKRFGIGGEDPQTLEEIATDIGVTRERVRQIAKRAERVLQHRGCGLRQETQGEP